MPRGYDPTRLIDLDVTDTQLVIGDSGAPGGSVDGTVVVVPISLAGPGITWSFGSVTAVGPDPSWSSTDRLGFGRRVAVEGDALAVSGGSDHVRLYTWGGTSYAVATTLVNPDAPSLNGSFGESISVDTSTGQARALVGIKGDFSIFSPDPPTPGRVELWVRNGGVWSLEATIPARPAALFGGYATGHEAALDGRWAVVGLHFVQVPAAGGSGTVDDYRLEIYDLQSGPPTFVREISPVALTGGVVPDQVQLAPVGVDVVGSHIVFDVWNSISSSPTQFSAFSVDRHPADVAPAAVQRRQLASDGSEPVEQLVRLGHLDQATEAGQLTGHTPHVPTRQLELDPARPGRPADADRLAEHLTEQSRRMTGSTVPRPRNGERFSSTSAVIRPHASVRSKSGWADDGVAGRLDRGHPVDPKRSLPGVGVRDQVPDVTLRREAERMDHPLGRFPLA